MLLRLLSMMLLNNVPLVKCQSEVLLRILVFPEDCGTVTAYLLPCHRSAEKSLRKPTKPQRLRSTEYRNVHEEPGWSRQASRQRAQSSSYLPHTDPVEARREPALSTSPS